MAIEQARAKLTKLSEYFSYKERVMPRIVNRFFIFIQSMKIFVSFAYLVEPYQ